MKHDRNDEHRPKGQVTWKRQQNRLWRKSRLSNRGLICQQAERAGQTMFEGGSGWGGRVFRLGAQNFRTQRWVQNRGDGGESEREMENEEGEVGSFMSGASKGGYVTAYWGAKPKTIPMKPEGREDIIQTLNARNKLSIEDRQSLEELAHNIIHILWEKVRGSIANSDLEWELRQTQSFRVHDTGDAIQQTPTFAQQQGNSMPEDMVIDAETGANASRDTSLSEGTQSRPLFISHNRPAVAPSGCDFPGDGQFYIMETGVFDTPNGPLERRPRVLCNTPRPHLTLPDKNGNLFPSLVQSGGSSAPVGWDGQLYNLGTDVFDAIFDTPNEPWNVPPPDQSLAQQPPLAALNNSNSFPSLVHSDNSSALTGWEGQLYNLGTDVFDAVLDTSNEPWNLPPPDQSHAQQHPLTALNNSNLFPSLVNSDGSSTIVGWDGQLYHLGRDVFDEVYSTPNESWNVPPQAHSDTHSASLRVSDQEVGSISHRPTQFLDTISQNPSHPADCVVSAG